VKIKMTNTVKGMSPLVAGVAGAAIGAAAVALSNKDNRQKMGKTVKDLQDRGNKFYHDIAKKTQELKSKNQKEIDKTKQDTKGLAQ
jgi:hypothetical protein